MELEPAIGVVLAGGDNFDWLRNGEKRNEGAKRGPTVLVLELSATCVEPLRGKWRVYIGVVR